MSARLPSRIGTFIEFGVAAEDDERERLRITTTTLIMLVVVVLSPAWIVTYVALGRPLSAAIPGAYEVISVGSLLWLALHHRFRALAGIQIIMFATLPVLLQWSLGGFEHGSAVALWSFSAPMFALVVYGVRAAMSWFVVFAASITMLGLFDGILRTMVAPPPAPVQIVFFVLNVVAPATTVMVLLIYFVRERDAANLRTEQLLLQILPGAIVARLKRGETRIADGYDDATVLFADIVDFTTFADTASPAHLVDLLSRAFNELDTLCARHGLEKIKTLGDGYLAVAGVTRPRSDHARAATAMALEVQPAVVSSLGEDWPGLRFRVGLASGPVVAGVIGHERFGFDVWGDTVNTASRMASEVAPGGVQVTEATWVAIRDHYRVERREAVEVKGKGLMTTYVVLGPLVPDASALTASSAS
jgi:adenylate cyclase